MGNSVYLFLVLLNKMYVKPLECLLILLQIPKADIDSRAIANGAAFDYTSYYDDKPLYTSDTFWGMEVYYSTILFASPGKLYSHGHIVNRLPTEKSKGNK